MRALFIVFSLGLFLTASAPAAAQHPSISAGKWLRVDFRARVQADVRDSEAPNPAEKEDDRLDIARRRVGVEGRAAGILNYQLEYEIGTRQWRDVYIDYRQFSRFRLRAGAFKLPFGLDENTSASDLDFVYRARISSRLAPGRDRGIMAHGRLANNRISYEGGLFRHDGDNARPSNSARVYGGRTIAARLAVRPFARSGGKNGDVRRVPDLEFGAAAAASTIPVGFPAIRARTVFGSSFFDSDVWVKGRRLRTGIEARWRLRRVSLQSEYIRVTDERRGQSVDGGDLSPLVADGWYVSGTYAIHEKRGRYGAVEAAGRYEVLKFGSAASTGGPSSSTRADQVAGNADHVVTGGISWQLNRWVKVQANIIREHIQEPSMGPLPERSAFWSRVFRLQLAM